MEDNSTDLGILISHRKQRPAFARMISWEFSREKEQKSSRQKNKLKKKLSSTNEQIDRGSENCDNGNDILTECVASLSSDDVLNTHTSQAGDSGESSESEYFSAEEEFNQSESEICDEDFAILVDTEQMEKLELTKLKDTVSTTGHSPKRSRSKKQKKKHRKMRTFYFNNILPFIDVENFELEVFDTIEQNVDVEDRLCLNKVVPTLVELCLQRVWGPKTRTTSSAELPPGIQPTVKDFNRQKSYFRHQLSYFHAVLAICEPEKGSDFEVLHCKENCDTHIVKWIFLKPARNIWNSIFRSKYVEQDFYEKSKATSFLLWTSANFDYGCDIYMNYQYGRNIIAAVASTIDLMMSSTVRMPTSKYRHRSGDQKLIHCLKPRHASGDQDLISSATKATICRVRSALSNRFPVVMKHCFDEALPYVFWARGNLAEAAQLFTILMQREHRVRHKAMYLAEVARMYALARETELAIKYHRMAADVALKKSYFEEEITGQLLILIASVYDQGVMSTQNCKMATKAWNAVLSAPSITADRAAIAAIESFLCFHSGGWKDQSTTWLDEAKSRLLSVVNNQKEMYFHLSLICSLLRQEREAQKYFSFFQQRNSDFSVNSLIEDFSGRNNLIRRNPWLLLQDFMKKELAVLPLVVVWRTQVAPLMLPRERYQSNSGLVVFAGNFADEECTRNPLRISPDGYVTGDMQLLLPPIRGVYLDPYTGSLAITHIPGYTETWHFVDKDQDHVVPTMTEIYNDLQGRTVHICYKDKTAVNRFGDSSFPLFVHWADSTGERTKFNLMYLMKVEMKKYAEKCLKVDSSKDGCDEKLIGEIRKEITRAFKQGKRLDYEPLVRLARQNLQSDERWEKKEKKGKQKHKSNPSRQENDTAFYPSTLELHCALGHSVLLVFSFSYSSVFVFLDCRDKNLFLQPKVIVYGSNDTPTKVWNSSGNFNPSIKLAIGPMISKLNGIQDRNHSVVCDEGGDVCDFVKNDQMDDSRCIPCVIGRRLFHLDEKRRLVSRLTKQFADADVEGTKFENEQKFQCTVDVVTCVPEGEVTDDVILKDVSLTVNDYISDFWIFQRQRTKTVADLGEVENIEVAAEKLVVLTTDGVTFLDPESLEPLVLNVACARQVSIPLSSDHKWLKGRFSTLKIIDSKKLESHDQNTVERLAIAISNHLLILEVPYETRSDMQCLNIVLCLSLPGHPKDFCFVSQSVGFLVSFTMHVYSNRYYREVLLHIDYNGNLHGILPMLGPGPRAFCVTYLTGNPDLTDKDPTLGTPGWYVYMRDGHSGVIGVKLSQ